jgi:hypothetical protein
MIHKKNYPISSSFAIFNDLKTLSRSFASELPEEIRQNSSLGTAEHQNITSLKRKSF